MRVRYIQLFFDLKHNYWFIPTVMALAAIALAAVCVAIDLAYVGMLPAGFDWLFRSQAEGARAILSTVAGSTITVAGVVFSMTILSVSHATANYGSRILLKFLDDRRNQFTLGTFTATFIYCLLVLRTVNLPDLDGSGGFVPSISVLVAIFLAVLSVGVLIAFIHHVPSSIYIGKVAANRGKVLLESLRDTFPSKDEGQRGTAETAFELDEACTIAAQKSGYIQALDVEGLVKIAKKNDLFVEVLKQPGDFVFEQSVIVRYTIEGEKQEEVISSDECQQQLASLFGIGAHRTTAQDTRFLLEELQQIAARALSPGINDPFTAMTCIDQLASAAAAIINQEPRQAYVADDEDVFRVRMPKTDFAIVFDEMFQPLSDAIATSFTASEHFIGLLLELSRCTSIAENRDKIREFALQFQTSIGANLSDEQRIAQLSDQLRPLTSSREVG